MKMKKILVEGHIDCPICEIYKIANQKGYSVKLIWNYDKFRKRGEQSMNGIVALFIGPRPHKVKNGSGNIQHYQGESKGIKIYVCSELNQNTTIKITKSSFRRAFEKFINSER